MTTQDTSRQLVLFKRAERADMSRRKVRGVDWGRRVQEHLHKHRGKPGISQGQLADIKACMSDLGLDAKDLAAALGLHQSTIINKLNGNVGNRFYEDEYSKLMHYFRKQKLARTFGKETHHD